MERLPQAFEQTADVLVMLGAGDKITVEQGDSKSEAAHDSRVADDCCGAENLAVHTEQLVKRLPNCPSASALFLMGGR
ncbi:hypothetical protein ACFWA4_16070 [Streptomyces sp. NPDC060011]|uniref:hypothetical protein n=1 Tax=Streptomyces sp. NPDC060011 TaxID=3347037 RepID=UPI00369FED03